MDINPRTTITSRQTVAVLSCILSLNPLVCYGADNPLVCYVAEELLIYSCVLLLHTVDDVAAEDELTAAGQVLVLDLLHYLGT